MKSKILALQPDTINRLPLPLAQIATDFAELVKEWEKDWEALPTQEKQDFLKNFGKDGKFVFGHDTVDMDFIKQIDESIAQTITQVFPEPIAEWQSDNSSALIAPEPADEPESHSEPIIVQNEPKKETIKPSAPPAPAVSKREKAEKKIDALSRAAKYLGGEKREKIDNLINVLTKALKYLK